MTICLWQPFIKISARLDQIVQMNNSKKDNIIVENVKNDGDLNNYYNTKESSVTRLDNYFCFHDLSSFVSNY